MSYLDTYTEMMQLRGLHPHTFKSYRTYVIAYLDYAERSLHKVIIPARNTPRIRKDGNRKSGGWKLSLRSIGNLDSGYLETCLL